MDNIQTEVVTEHLHHLLAFVQTQQTVIDEDAGQLLTDGAMQQHGHHGGVDTAGETQDHLVTANLLANAGDGIVDDGGRRPQRFTTTDIFDEVLQHARSLTGVRHFRVELHAVETAGFVGHGGMGAARRRRGGDKAFRDRGNLVTMAHPDVQQRRAGLTQRIFNLVEQSAGTLHLDLGIAKFAMGGGAFHLATELLGHGLHAIADTHHRDTSFKHVLRRPRATRLGDRLRAAGEDDAVRLEFADLLFGDIPGPQFAVDTDFPHATGDQLGDL